MVPLLHRAAITRRCGTDVQRDGRSAEYRCGRKDVAPFSATTRPTYTKPGSYAWLERDVIVKRICFNFSICSEFSSWRNSVLGL